MSELHDPGNEDKIETIYVVMSIDAEGRNGICAAPLPGLGTTPLVTARERLLPAFKALAAEVASMSGKEVGLFAFARGEQIWSTKENR